MQPTHVTRNSVSPLLKNLALPESDTPNCVQKAVSKARLLTSHRCLAELKEKEKEKKKVREEKGLERLKKLEEKKRQREETLEKRAAKQCKVEQAKRPSISRASRTG